MKTKRIHLIGSQEFVVEPPIIRLVNALFEKAIEHGATHVLLQPGKNAFNVSMQIGAKLEKFVPIPKRLERSVSSRLKIMTNLSIATRGILQSGDVLFSCAGKRTLFAVTIIPTGSPFAEWVLIINRGTVSESVLGTAA